MTGSRTRLLNVVLAAVLAAAGIAAGLGLQAAEPPFPVVWQGMIQPVPVGIRLGSAAAYGGKIYVFGGANCSTTSCNVALNNTQIYDPATDTWTQGAPMPTARFGLTAVEYQGKIYVMGGRDGADSNFVKSANEVYDPATDSWTTKKAMPTALRGHSAVLVGSKIYVFGGAATNLLKAVSIYDPAADSWSSGANMPRVGYYGVAVAVGTKVYYCGGGDGTLPFGTILVYDSVANSWQSGSIAMIEAAQFFGAAADSSGSNIYMMSGEIDEDANTTYMTQVLNTATNTVSEGTPTPSPLGRSQHIAVNCDGKIYVMGGSSGSYSGVDVFDPASGSWYEPNPFTPEYLGECNLQAINGQLYLLNGGWSAINDKVYKLDPNGGTWTSTNAVNPKPRLQSVSGVHDGKIVFADGVDSSSEVGDAYLYDPAADTFTALAPDPAPRRLAAGAVVNGVLYVFGGQSGSTTLDTTNALDIASKTWSSKAKMPKALQQFCACAFNNRVYIFGGLTKDLSLGEDVIVYDPASNTFATDSKIPRPNYRNTCAVYGDYILLMGDDGLPDVFQVYKPSTKTWYSSVAPYTYDFPSSAVIGDKLYVTGGQDYYGWPVDRLTVVGFTTGPQPLRASASGSPTTGAAPLNVQFTGSASGGTAPYTYSWTFGDGGTSTSQSPSHTYEADGSYTATLTVTDSASGTATANVFITVGGGSPLSATATATPTTGPPPLAVSFTCTPSGGDPPYAYAWDFGDGATSTDQNPSHTYDADGVYTASVTVTDSESATITKTLTITVVSAQPPVISLMKKLGNPFRINVTGSNLQNGIQVYINGTPWTNVTWKSTTNVKIKGGGALKALVPKSTPTTFRFVNPDGGEVTLTWQWP